MDNYVEQVAQIIKQCKKPDQAPKYNKTLKCNTAF